MQKNTKIIIIHQIQLQLLKKLKHPHLDIAIPPRYKIQFII